NTSSDRPLRHRGQLPTVLGGTTQRQPMGIRGGTMAANENHAQSLESFEAMALPHRGDLYRAAVAMLSSRVEAEDIVHEVYLQAWKSFHRFTPGTNVRAWLFRIMFHVVSHHRRKWYHRFVVPKEAIQLEETAFYEPPVPETLRDEEILQAFQSMPQSYAEV